MRRDADCGERDAAAPVPRDDASLPVAGGAVSADAALGHSMRKKVEKRRRLPSYWQEGPGRL